MSAYFREDPFESLNNEESSIPQEKFRIPSDLVTLKEEQCRKISSILTFEYDISRKHFQYITSQEVKSLFFDLHVANYGHSVLANFIILRFSEKEYDETILNMDRTVETILREGIEFKNNTYNIVGCSNSQVQKKSFVFMNGTREECDAAVQYYIPSIVKLEQMKGVAKRVKYAGLLFTGCQHIITLPPCNVNCVSDVQIGSFNFTDGCGLISMKLAKEIVNKTPELQKKWKNDIPSVWQIRFYNGIYLCKGVLVLDQNNTTSSVLTLRQSLIKVTNTGSRKGKKRLGIVGTSFKPKIGKLNKQVVTLLSVSIPKDILLGKQEKYFKSILETRTSALEAVKSAALRHQMPIFKKLLRNRALEGFLPKEYTSLVKIVEESFMSTWHKEGGNIDEISDKIQIPLASSRLLFGAAFPEELGCELEEGQCIVCTENGIYEGLVIVNRSPSYSPGDIRVIEAVKPKKINSPVLQMRNVIFFATRGKRPDPDKMSGGDLDGDMYLVIWDKELLKFATSIKAVEPMNYVHISEKKLSTEHWLSYVAKWENSILAQVDSCFYHLAEKHGVNSIECKELCELFSRAVDQVSSDLNKLKHISSKCLVPTKKEGFIHIPDNLKPVWVIMIERTADTLRFLKEKRDKFPSKKDWVDFYTSLIHLDSDDVLQVLRSPDVFQCVMMKNIEIDQVKEHWLRICKGRALPELDEIVKPTCSYDCEVKDCVRSHSTEPVFYCLKWREKMHSEIMHIIRDTIEEKENICKNISEHEDQRKEMEKMNTEAIKIYKKEQRKIIEKRLPVKQITNTFSQIIKYDELIEKAGGNIKESTFWENIATGLGFVRKPSNEEKQALQDISHYEKELLTLYHHLTNEANIISLEFDIPGVLHVTFESLPDRSSQIKIQNNIKSLVTRAQQHKSLADPELIIPPSCVENIDKLIAITKGKKEDLMEKKKRNMEELINIESLIKDIEKRKKKITEDINCNYNNTNLLERFSKSCKKELAKLMMSSTGREHNELIVNALCDEKLLGNCKSSYFLVNLILQNVDIHQIKSVYQRDIPQLIEEKLYVLAQITQQLKEDLENLTVEESGLKITLNSLKKLACSFEESIKFAVTNLSSLDSARRFAYNKEEHDKEIQKYHDLDTGRVEGFDLALNALDHEVESCFAGEKITEKDRISATKALRLCLLREKKRCQRELSEINLPVFCKRAEILEALKKHDAVIVVAQTGSGKSTQVPQYLADDLHHALSRSSLLNNFPKIACTQPRRVACQRIAERVSQEYAGAVDMPIKTIGVKEQVKRENLGVKRACAYPLYAKLSQADQNRALDIHDRVGFDQTFDEKKEIETPQNSQINLSRTPGELGEWVGFHIGSKGKSFEEKKHSKKFSKETRIHFVTEGLLLQKLKGTKNETSYNCIIIDEAHERGRDTDLLLAHLRTILKITKNAAYKGNNLKVVVMSASIDQKVFSDYFGGCPVVECDGRMFDVSNTYLPPPSVLTEKKTGIEVKSDFDSASLPEEDSSWDMQSNEGSYSSEIGVIMQSDDKSKEKKESEMDIIIKHAVDIIFSEVVRHDMSGDVLIFLPGQGEIDSCVDMINTRATKESQEQNRNQIKCFRTRKIVCCTNIAETSLTIPGVTFVLDGGKAKKIMYNSILRVSALKVSNISKASAKQRMGRAGRVEPGVCIKLYSQQYHEEMKAFDEPEMKQIPIDELYLYTLDVFGGLENIDLMEDACPERETIYNAKKRLINLRYVQTDKDEVEITTEGLFALSLTGQVSLEGSKMILESQKYDIVDDALALAVVLEAEKIFTRRENNEERLKYFDELGDHLTIFNIYKHFLNKMENGHGSKDIKTKLTKSWCEDLGLNFGTLQQIPNSISSVYETIKREKKCNVANMFIKKKSHKKQGNRKKKNANQDVKSLLDNREKLMKLIVSGYFHNIGLLHDPEYIKSGYSLITPSNYGDSIFDSEQADLLKVVLSKESSLMLFGDLTENTAVIFKTLFEPTDGFILMKISSKIKPEWINECASNLWAESIGLKVCNSSVIKSYVTRESYTFIGPPVMARLLKLEDENKDRFLKVLQKESNAKVRLLFETSELKVYGSKKEILKVQPQLLSKINELKSKLIGEDSVERYPKPKGDKQELCTINAGLVVSGVLNINLLRPEIITDWTQIQSATLMLHKDIQSENHIKNVFTSLRSELSPELIVVFEEPIVTMLGTELAKIRFKRHDIASEFESLLRGRLQHFQFSHLTKCFFDNEVQIKVIRTSLYPSVHFISEHYSSLMVAEPGNRGELFKIKLVKKPPKNAYVQIDEFIQELREQQLFGSEIVEDLNCLAPGTKEYIYWKIGKILDKEELEEENNVIINKRREPAMFFEIYGEYNNRINVARKISEMIRNLKYDIENSVNNIYTYTFNRKIPMPSCNMTSLVIFKIKKLRAEHQNIKMTILLDGSDGNKSLPVVHVLGDNKNEGLKAVADIEKCFETDFITNEEPVCSICLSEVLLRKSPKQKKKEKQELMEARQNNKSTISKQTRIEDGGNIWNEGFRLMICGCTYCKECFKRMVKKQLNEQRETLKHEGINCVHCRQTVLVKDIRNSGLGEYWRDNLYEQILKNYLLLYMQNMGGGRIDKCGKCNSLMILCSTDTGLYRCHNDKCRFLFCCKCGKRCMGNQIDFDAHEQCSMVIREIPQRGNHGNDVMQQRQEYYYNGDYYL